MIIWIINGVILTALNLLSLFFGLVCLLPDFYRFLFRSKEMTALYKKLGETQDYQEWLKIGAEIDKATKRLKWRTKDRSSLYDYNYVKNMTKHVKHLLKKKNPLELASFIRSILSRDFANITNEKLYKHIYTGTKQLIEDYYDTILESLDYLHKTDFPDKFLFFQEIKHFYGKTSLMLSGGAAVGMFHLGLVANLIEQKILPHIIAGASAGSLTCAFLGTNSDQELKALTKENYASLDFSAFEDISSTGSLIRKVIRLIRYGYFIDKTPLLNFVKTNTFNLTFKEAFLKTNRIINISVSDNVHNKSLLLNYITAPNVYVWSAAIASCSLPFVYAPTKLIAKDSGGSSVKWLPGKKKFVDGSLGADVPKKSLSVLFNATNFIVSQVNVFIVPFVSRGTYRRHSRGYVFLKLWGLISGVIISEFKHRIQQLDHLNIIPKKLALWANLMLQEYSGNINIYPKLQFRDIFQLLDNPNKESVISWCKRGKNTTFSGNLKSH